MRAGGRRRGRTLFIGMLSTGVIAASAGIALQPWRAEGVGSPPATGSTPQIGVAPVVPRAAAAASRKSVPTPTPTPTASAPATVSPTPVPSPSSAVAGGVIAADGSVDPAAYRRTAAAMGTAAGVAYRFGAASTAPKAGRPTAPRPPSKTLQAYENHPRATYQLAGPQDPSKNDYSSNQGQVGYLSTRGAKTPGVDTIETLSMRENTFSAKPRLSWTLYGKGHPAPDLVGDGGSAKCLARQKKAPGRFVAQARAYAHGERTANTLAVFDSGIVAALGTNTARGGFCMRLPQRLHPTAISITNGNEFALITVWNTDSLRSELAVIALGGKQKAGAFWDYEWTELYPGFRNYGMPTFGKLLGTVALPMAAATGVSAVSDQSFGSWLSTPGGSNVQPMNLPLSNEANRQSFISGKNRNSYSKAGYAVVFSREEHKVAFVDLQPLFGAVSKAYFGSRGTFDSALRNTGTAAGQYPRAFSAAPASAPVVVKTVTTAQAPTAIAGMLSGAATPRAYVATADGKLHVFAVGGLASAAGAKASAITETGTIAVGANPTSITYAKDHHDRWENLDRTLIVTSRGDRSVQWVTLKGPSGTVTKRLRDSRLVDPISAEDNNTHGTDSYVVAVADYGAGRLFSYRYGPVVFHTNGGARYDLPRGSGFEFDGSYDPKGRPFSISITNVS